MTLSQAIRSLVEAKGLSILTSPMALNILSDYNAFSEYPSSKNILKNIIGEGYLEKIAFFYDNQLPLGDAPQTYLSEMYMKLGFRHDVSAYVLNSILDALGYGAPLSIVSNDIDENPIEQTTSEASSITPNLGNHFEFKGVIINGSKDEVADALQKQGYEFVDGGEDGILLNGKFAGIDNCQILVTASQHTHQTYSVSVFTPEALTWWSIKADYDRINEMLRKKYGRPSSSTEFFSDPYDEGDGYELTALSTGNAMFVTSYSSKDGDITLHITDAAQLLITYKDKINGEEHDMAESIAAENDI